MSTMTTMSLLPFFHAAAAAAVDKWSDYGRSARHSSFGPIIILLSKTRLFARRPDIHLSTHDDLDIRYRFIVVAFHDGRKSSQKHNEVTLFLRPLHRLTKRVIQLFIILACHHMMSEAFNGGQKNVSSKSIKLFNMRFCSGYTEIVAVDQLYNSYIQSNGNIHCSISRERIHNLRSVLKYNNTNLYSYRSVVEKK